MAHFVVGETRPQVTVQVIQNRKIGECYAVMVGNWVESDALSSVGPFIVRVPVLPLSITCLTYSSTYT